MYNCECGRKFESKQAFMGHCSHCKSHKEKRISQGIIPVSEKVYTCICGFSTTNKQSYARHCGFCSVLHPDKSDRGGSTGKHWHQKAWNEGLTKESDCRVMKISESLKGKSHPHSEESKAKISEALKKAHAEGRSPN